MPTGPNGEVRPASSISAMVMAMKIATGEIEEQYVSEEHKKTHNHRKLRLKIIRDKDDQPSAEK